MDVTLLVDQRRDTHRWAEYTTDSATDIRHSSKSKGIY